MPNAKILVCLRNPVDQVQSHYWHLRRQNFHQPHAVQPVPEIFDALERFPELLLEPALYGKHLARWLEYFPRDQLFVIRQEDMRTNPQAEIDRLCVFLGIAVDSGLLHRSRIDDSESRQGVHPRSAGVENIYKALYSAVSRGPYLWLKRVLGVKAADMLKRKLRGRQILENMFFKPGYPTWMRASGSVSQLFRDDIAILRLFWARRFPTGGMRRLSKPERRSADVAKVADV